jgi:hypothetical protein
MHSCRLISSAILICAATSGCYMNIKGVEDSGRLAAIEQRLCAIEQALGIPSPPPPVEGAGHSETSAKIRVKQAVHEQQED